MGPYNAQEAGTKVVKTQKVVPIPHFLVRIWLAEPDEITAVNFGGGCTA